MPENSRTDSQLTPAQLTACLAGLAHGSAPRTLKPAAHRDAKQNRTNPQARRTG
jgi:hypothetical protein